ncbi:MAG: class II SORL domain-containing protein [Lentisphaeria bacterium]
MAALSANIKQADWKTEKHVPVIEAPEQVRADELFAVSVTLGKEVTHPNTTEHHIAWVELYFQGDSEKAPHLVGRFTFGAHGESAKGPNEGPVYTHHCGGTSMKLGESGKLSALAYCNIHGLWESDREVKVG